MSGDRGEHYQEFTAPVQRYLQCEPPQTLWGKYFLLFRKGWGPELLGASGRTPVTERRASLLALIKEFEPGISSGAVLESCPEESSLHLLYNL